jgi:predicted transcriptional regulator
MRTVSFKLPIDLDDKLSALARRRRVSRSSLVREALEAAGASAPLSVTQLAGDLVGSVEGPGDLSSNPEHLADFGK